MVLNSLPSNQQTRHPKIIALTAFVALLLIAGFVFVGYDEYQKSQAIAKERAAYNQAEKDLDATVAKITAKFGKPDDSTKDKSCGYTSNPNEFEQGDLYCNVEEYLTYPTRDLDSSVKLSQQIENSLGTENAIKYKKDKLTIETPPVDLGVFSYDDSDLDCSRAYTYQTQQWLAISSYPTPKLLNSSQGLSIELGCSARQPKAAYYPIKNP